MNARAKHTHMTHGDRGLTVIELMVALTLSTLLIVSVLGLLRNMKVHCRQLMRRADCQPWEQLLAEQVRRDLANGRQLIVEPNHILITGYLGSAGASHSSTLQAAQVTYHVAHVDDRAYLLRDDRPLDELSNAVGSRQIVASGVESFRLILPDERSFDETYAGPVPVACRLRFYEKDSAEPAMELLWAN